MTGARGQHPSASVVIPTFNRLEALQRVLDAVDRQDLPGPLRPEVIVVDDGSSDGTAGWLRSEASRGRLTALTGSNAGPATARNRGMAAASGDVLLFLGDDTEPAAGWLLAHLEEHRLFGGEDRRPLAVVGYTGFPSRDDTPFARFINEHGAQFGYQLIEDAHRVPFNFFYTSNVSIGRSVIAGHGGFREDFPAAAWEDIELAYRATRAGMRIHYQPLARTTHHHRVRPRTFCHRQRTAGRSAAIFGRLHPELEDFLGVGRLDSLRAWSRAHRAVLGLAVLVGEHVPGLVPPSVLHRYVELCYLEGLAEGLQER